MDTPEITPPTAETPPPAPETESQPGLPDPYVGREQQLVREHAELLQKLDEARSQIAALAEENSALGDKIKQFQQEIAALVADRDQLAAQLAAATKEPTVRRGAKSAKARKIATSPRDRVKFDDETLLAALRDAPHSVAFSDGAQEITSLAPIVAAGKAWTVLPTGVMLIEPIMVSPDRPVEIAGFGLFDDDGKQIAYAALATVIRVAPGQQVKLDRQIIF